MCTNPACLGTFYKVCTLWLTSGDRLCWCVCLSGSPPAAVWRRGGDEAVRQGHHQRQPAHFPAQQEILREIEKRKKDKRAKDTDLNHEALSEGGRRPWPEPAWLTFLTALLLRALCKFMCIIFYYVDHRMCFTLNGSLHCATRASTPQKLAGVSFFLSVTEARSEV